jgi:cytochrome c oxidase assembly factor CtaG
MLYGLSLAWSWNLGGFLCFVILGALYMFGVWRVHVRHQRDAQVPEVSALRITSFWIGLIIFALLFFSPVQSIGRTQLFSVHMAEVVVLTTLCAPLLVGGCSAVLLEPVLDVPVVSSLARFLTNPIVTSIIFNGTFLLWHAPKIYNAASGSVFAYNFMMITIFIASLFNWWPVVGSLSELKKIGYPLQMLYIILDGEPVDIFAFILVYTSFPLYTHYIIPAQLGHFGFTAFGDQAAAGAMLLLPGLVDLAVMTPLFISWMGQIERRTRIADARRQEEREEIYYDDEEDEEEVPLQQLNLS